MTESASLAGLLSTRFVEQQSQWFAMDPGNTADLAEPGTEKRRFTMRDSRVIAGRPRQAEVGRRVDSLRRSCREGICGSDAININGRNGLECQINMNDLASRIVLRQLPGLPVIRDLIVDMTSCFNQYHSVMPYLINDTPREACAGSCRYGI